MTMTRQPRRIEISAEAVRTWRLIQAIRAAGDAATERWENEGGRRREFLNAEVALHRLLGLYPWQMFPSDCGDARPPRWMTDPADRVAHMKMHQVYLRLQQAVAEEDAHAGAR